MENEPGMEAGHQTEFESVSALSKRTDRGVPDRVDYYRIDVAKVKHAPKKVAAVVPEPTGR
jgi:hypothetical protein